MTEMCLPDLPTEEIQPSIEEETPTDMADATSVQPKGVHRLTLNARYLADVADVPAKPLRLGRLDPEAQTILYGDGGTGKGLVAAWWVSLLSGGGEVVLVLDYEHHTTSEWAPRLRAFGADEQRVAIAEPSGPIWQLADDTRRLCEEVRASWLVVDSVGYACVRRSRSPRPRFDSRQR